MLDGLKNASRSHLYHTFKTMPVGGEFRFHTQSKNDGFFTTYIKVSDKTYRRIDRTDQHLRTVDRTDVRVDYVNK